MRFSYCRLDGGEPLRAAMKAGGWKLHSLAERTAEVDPDGRGVSWQLISLLRSGKPWARDRCKPQSAKLIAAALGRPEGELFARPGAVPEPVR